MGGLVYLPKYMEQIEYARMRGQVQAIDAGLPEMKDKIGSIGKLFSLLVVVVLQACGDLIESFVEVRQS